MRCSEIPIAAYTCWWQQEPFTSLTTSAMASPTSEIVTKFDFKLESDAKSMVVAADELILMILEAVYEPVDPQVHRLSQNEKNYRRCMLVNRKWCKWAQRFLWKDLTLPQNAFDAVLQQFDTPQVDIFENPITVSQFSTSFNASSDRLQRIRSFDDRERHMFAIAFTQQWLSL